MMSASDQVLAELLPPKGTAKIKFMDFTLQQAIKNKRIDELKKFNNNQLHDYHCSLPNDGTNAIFYEPALCYAIRLDCCDVVQYLYQQQGAFSPAIIDKENLRITINPLVYAILCGQREILKFFLGLKTDKIDLSQPAYQLNNIADDNKAENILQETQDIPSILCAAITCCFCDDSGDLKNLLIKDLIEAGAQLKQGAEEQSVIEYCCQADDHLALFSILIENGMLKVDEKYNGKTILDRYFEYDKAKAAEFCQKHCTAQLSQHDYLCLASDVCTDKKLRYLELLESIIFMVNDGNKNASFIQTIYQSISALVAHEQQKHALVKSPTAVPPETDDDSRQEAENNGFSCLSLSSSIAGLLSLGVYAVGGYLKHTNDPQPLAAATKALNHESISTSDNSHNYGTFP